MKRGVVELGLILVDSLQDVGRVVGTGEKVGIAIESVLGLVRLAVVVRVGHIGIVPSESALSRLQPRP